MRLEGEGRKGTRLRLALTENLGGRREIVVAQKLSNRESRKITTKVERRNGRWRWDMDVCVCN